MKFKTYDEWLAAGYHVVKGEKSHRRSFGKPVFSEKQVTSRQPYDYDYEHEAAVAEVFGHDADYGW